MSLTDLPPELFEPIIIHTLPEGIESLALSCKAIHALCIPFIRRHNRLRLLFQNFNYCLDRNHLREIQFSPIRNAFDLIARIAVEPAVARYIETADLYDDSESKAGHSHLKVHDDRNLLAGQPGWPKPAAEDVADLLANSPYLAQAGIDWREYNAEIINDIASGDGHAKQRTSYSQRAAAFLLTLLPKVQTLRLPREWTPTDVTDKLIDAVIYRARQPPSSCCTPSLAQVTKFGSSPETRGALFSPSRPSPFLGLPQLESFNIASWRGTSEASRDAAFRYAHDRFGKSLEHVVLALCCFDEIAIAAFLQHTPRLKTLVYTHYTRNGGFPGWNFCNFATAVEREVGHHLEELLILDRMNIPILPGKTTMRGFQCLRTLECPFDFVISMMEATDTEFRAATSKQPPLIEELTDHEPGNCDLWIGAFIPASLSHLSLQLEETSRHDKALEVLFRDFVVRKNAQLPALALADMSLERHIEVEDGYEEGFFDEWVAEVKKAGVVVQVDEWDEFPP